MSISGLAGSMCSSAVVVSLSYLFEAVATVWDKIEVGVIRPGHLNCSFRKEHFVTDSTFCICSTTEHDFSRLRRRSLAKSVKLFDEKNY